MALQIQQLSRKFRYNGANLPDPGQQLSLDAVKDIFSAAFPELATATISAPVRNKEDLVYTFEVSAGSKG